MKEKFKIVVYVPVENADALREAMSNAGAGVIGNYTHCSFSMRGVGRFKPQEEASPTIGKVSELEQVEEERIETICSAEKLEDVLKTIKEVHPYEEPATDVYRLEDF